MASHKAFFAVNNIDHGTGNSALDLLQCQHSAGNRCRPATEYLDQLRGYLDLHLRLRDPPQFVWGIFFILVFALALDWFPTGGWEGPEIRILPVVTYALAPIAAIARYTRASVIEALRADDAVMRVVDVMSALPTLLLARMGAGYWNVLLAIGLTSWIEIWRLTRGQFLSLREKEFIGASRMGDGLRDALDPQMIK